MVCIVPFGFRPIEQRATPTSAQQTMTAIVTAMAAWVAVAIELHRVLVER